MTYFPISNSNEIEVGTIREFATAVPSGWLNCNGGVVAQATYPALYTAIGTTFNTGGEGAGNFRLPDKRRRVSVGSGGTGTSVLGNALGNAGGAETHTLIIDEMPAHTHNYQQEGGGGATLGGDYSGGTWNTTTSTGGGQAHNNMQPSIILNYGIKY